MTESKPSAAWIFLTIFASGIITQKFISIPESYLFPLFVFSAVFLLFLSIKFARISNWFALIFIFITGIFCAGKTDIGYEKQIPFFPDKVISITGEVVDVKERGSVLVLTIGNTSFFNGKIWIKSGVIVKTSLSQNKQVYESDWVLIDGIKSIKKERNQIFVYARHYKIIEPQSYYGRFRYKTQVFTENITRRWFRYHGQAASIFQMMVFGNSRQSPDVKDVFIRTGTYHLLIVSGIHLGYLLIFLRILAFPIRKFEQVHYKIFNLLYFNKQRNKEVKSYIDYETFFYPLDAINDWNKIYGKSGFIQYQMVIPKEKGKEGMRKILETIAKSGNGSFLAVLKLFGENNPNA
ncbi:MAG TPA: ComEC/Rec2 family competence protein, partial [bacterium]|nr:ComEC/Rec2 family competence protein [bacterium]